MKTILFFLLLIFPAFTFSQESGTDSTKTFLVLIGGGTLPAGSVDSIALFDNVILQRFNYDDIGGNTYSAIKTINPDIKIYLYQYGYWTHLPDSSLTAVYRRSIGRFRDMWDNHLPFFLQSAASDTIHLNGLKDYLLDFGNSDFPSYWLSSTNSDIITQAWNTDGIFSDITVPLRSTLTGSLSSAPVDYPYDAYWTTAANDFIDSLSVGLSASSLLGINYGNSRVDSGVVAWSALNSLPDKPTFSMEEGAFCTWYGYDVSFYTEAQWLNQLTVLNSVTNIQTFFQGITGLSPGESGTDNYSKSVTFYDALWFCLTSFKLGQHANSYFGFGYNNLYTHYTYFPDFNISIGNAMSDFQSTSISGTTIYFREFQKGYIYVNPSNTDLSSITLPTSCKQLTHANFQSNPALLPVINSISLSAHRGAILLKTTGNPVVVDGKPVMVDSNPITVQ